MSSEATFWCHACIEPVVLQRRDIIICPHCNGGFLQEVDEETQGITPQHGFSTPQLERLSMSDGSPIGRDVDDVGDDSSGIEEVEVLVEQLSMNDRGGPPPASPSSINAMPTIKISQQHVSSDACCSVCQEKFELGSEAKEMIPCNHIFHSDCIVPWLVQHNSCPVCRVKLPRQLPRVGSRGRTNPLSWFWPFRSSNGGSTSC